MEKKTFEMLLISKDGALRRSVEAVLKESERPWALTHTDSKIISEKMLSNGGFDGILVDMGVFGFKGGDAVKWIREYDADTPIIVLSGADWMSFVHDSITKGALGCLPKSHLDNIPVMLENAIRRREIGAERKRVENLLAGLYDVAVEILRHKGEEALLAATAKEAARLLKCEESYLYIWSPESGKLVIRGSYGVDPKRPGADLLPGEGMAGRIFQNDRPMSVEDYPSWEGQSENYRQKRFASVMGVPIKSEENKVLGVLEVVSYQRREFSQAEIHALELVARIVSVGSSNVMATKRWQEQVETFRKASEEIPNILMELDPAAMLERLALTTRSLLHADKVGVMLKSEGHDLKWLYTKGLSEKYKGFVGKNYTLLPGKEVLKGSIVMVPDTQDESIHPLAREAFKEENIASYLVLPITIKLMKRTGAMILYRSTPQPFLEHEVHLAEILVGNVSVALDNAYLFSVVERGKREWESTFDALEEGVLLLGKDLTILRANKRQAQMSGVPVQEIVGRKCYEMVCHQPEAPRDCPVLEALQKKAGVSREGEGAHNLPGIYDIEVVPVLENGEVSGLVRVARDITEKRQLEERIQERERYLANIVNSSGDAIFGVSTDGIIMSWNPAAERIFGYSAEEIVGKSYLAIIPEHVGYSWNGVVGGSAQSAVTDAVKKNGDVITVSATAAPILDDDGEVIGISAIVRDITQKVRTEFLMRALNDAALRVTSAESEEAVLNILGQALANERVSNILLRLGEDGRLSVESKFIPGQRDIPQDTLNKTLSSPKVRQMLSEVFKRTSPEVMPGLSDVFPPELGRRIIALHVLRPAGDTLLWLLAADFLSEEYVPTLSAFADLANSTLERIHWEQETQTYLMELERLNILAEMGTAAIPIGERLKKALEMVRGILQADLGVLALSNPPKGEVAPIELAAQGLDDDTLRQIKALIMEVYLFRKSSFIAGEKREAPLYETFYLDDLLTSKYKAAPVEIEIAKKVGLTLNFLAFLKAGGEPVGTLYLGFKNPDTFKHYREGFLETLLRQFGLVVRETTLLGQARARASRLQQTHLINARLASMLDEEELLRETASMVGGMLENCGVAVALTDKDNEKLIVKAIAGRDAEECVKLEEEFPLEGKGLMTYCAQNQETVLVGDVSKDPRYLECIPSTKSEMVIPILSRGEVLGVLDLQANQQSFFDEQDAILLEDVARQLASSLENARLINEERLRRQEAETLRDVALALSTTLDRDKVIDLILSRLQTAVPYDTASVQILHENTLEIIGGRGFQDLSEVIGAEIDPAKPPNREVISSRSPYILKDAPETYESFKPDHLPKGTIIRSWMGVPMQVGDRVIGMITLDKREPDFYKEEHARMALAFATQAAVAIENARLYEEIKNANEELKEALRLREELVQNVSHELRTPLALIRGYAELMLSGGMGSLSPEQEAAIQVMVRRSQDLSSMVDDLLTLKSPVVRSIERDEIDLKAMADETVSEMGVKAREAGIKFERRFTDKPVIVLGNRKYLQRVMNNLLDNAIKFSPDGGTVTVSLQISPESGENEAVLEVTDAGIGILPDKLEKIFDRFYQVDGSTTRRFGGAGIGLALVKEIVAAHGGRVWAESTGIPGEGSTFHVTLPIASKKGPARHGG